MTDRLLDELREAAALYGLFRRRSVAGARAALQAGRLLVEIRARTGRGAWQRGLEAAGISYRTAARLMQLARSEVSAAELARQGIRGALEALAAPRAEGKVAPPRAGKPEPPPPPADESAQPDSKKSVTGDTFLPSAQPDRLPAGAPDVGQIWQAVREQLERELDAGVFASWIVRCAVEAREAGPVAVLPTVFMRDRVERDYGDRIRELWTRLRPGEDLRFGVAAPGTAQPSLPLPGGRAAATTGNVTVAIAPRTAQGNAPGLRLAAAATVVGDRRLRSSTKLLLASLAWQYWPGRPWRGDVESLGALSGLGRSAAYEALEEACRHGHLHAEAAQGRRSRTIWWPVIEIAAETGWTPPEQYALPLQESLDRAAVAYIAKFAGIAAYG